MNAPERLSSKALSMIGDGDFRGAANLLEKAMLDGILSAELLHLFAEVSDQLREPGRVAKAIRSVLDDEEIDVPLPVQTDLLTELVRRTPEADRDERRQLLIRLSNIAAWASDELWDRVDRAGLDEAITAALLPPVEGFSLAEQLLFAPAHLPWPDLAAQTIELAASQPEADDRLIRAAERLLHAASRSEAAYRLEQHRKHNNSRQRSPKPPRRKALEGIAIAIAGGHPPFRAMAKEAVEEEGGTFRAIPSRFESVRRERDILGALKGANAAVIVVPQIAHSTSDQITRVSRRLDLPVLYLRSASVETLLSLLRDWQLTRNDSLRDDA